MRALSKTKQHGMISMNKQAFCRNGCDFDMDNILLLSGLAVSGGVLIIAAVYFIVYRLNGEKLQKALDKEYG